MGSSNTPMDAHPRFGFTPKTLFDGPLTNASLVSPALMRTEGLRFVVIPGIFTLLAGSGEVKLILEGSNDGVNWFVCAESGPTELFDTNGQEEILNQAGSGQVDLEHFDLVRVRATIESGSPTFSLRVIVSGIARDSEKFLRIDTFLRSGAAPTVQDGPAYVRPAGTRLVNCEIVASGVVLGGVAQFDVVLEGSPKNTDEWFPIGTATVTGDGALLMDVKGERFFSLGSYSRFRIIVQDVGGAATGATAFSISTYISLDSADWTSDTDASGSPFDPNEVFVQVAFGTPSAEVSDIISVSLQLYDADGGVMNEMRKLECILYDTSDVGDLDLAFNAVFDALTAGAVLAGLATNRLVFRTDANGQATFDILDGAAETVYLTGVNARANRAAPMYIAAAQQAALTFGP